MNDLVVDSWRGVRACVIGGTGFLGYQIVNRLLSRMAAVRVLAPDAPPDHPICQRSEVEWIRGDIRDRSALAAAAAGCRVVFQASGPVYVGTAKRVAQLDSHTAGTHALLAALPPTCRLVHTSSLVTIGGTRDGRVLDESSPYPNARLPIEYIRAKRLGEVAALKAAGEGADVVVTNPAYLIGPHDYGKSVMGNFCTRFWRGRIPFAPPGGYNLVDVRDVGEGHVLAAERGRRGERYFLGGENLPLKSFVELLAAAAGYRPRWLPTCPTGLLGCIAALQECRGRLLGKTPYPSFEHVRLNRFTWFATAEKATRELGYSARPVKQSVADAFHWHSSHSPWRTSGFNRWWLRAT